MLTNQVSVAVVGADKVLLGGNMKRRCLTVSSNSSTFGTINFGAPAVDGSGQVVGYPVQNTSPPLVITREQVGDRICNDIHGVMSAGGATFTLTEDLGP